MSNTTSGYGVEARSINWIEAIEADPIGLDEVVRLGKIAITNKTGDRNQIAEYLKIGVDRLSEPEFSLEEKWAAVRDLGILAGSLLKIGADPFEAAPGFRETSSGLGTDTGMPPYHTVVHYSTLNPVGQRERSFTGSSQEAIFIEQVRKGMAGFLESANLLFPLFGDKVSLSSEEALRRLKQALTGIETGIGAIPVVMRQVGADFFAKELRPYFNQLCINGESFDAPGGAQMPLIAVDHVLWSSDDNDPGYALYRNKNLKYLPPFLKMNVQSTMGQPSLKTRILLNHEGTQETRELFERLMARLYSFRSAHGKLAKDSFGYRHSGAVGSGGDTPDLLDNLTALTHSYGGGPHE